MKDRGERGEGGGSLKYSIPEGKRGWGQHVLIFTPGNLSRGKQTRSRLLPIFLSVVYHNLMENKLKMGMRIVFFLVGVFNLEGSASSSVPAGFYACS